MKPVLHRLVDEEPDALRKRSTVREYLQARILQALQDSGAFAHWAFLGGTALRFLFDLPRYSEDLDFSLVAGDAPSEFEKHIDRVLRDLSREAYDVAARSRTEATVHSAFLRFRGLLHELGLSGHAEEVISVKVELDTNPPGGAHTETDLVRRFVIINMLHYDRASLFAGKLHAILARSYTKGRDLYDLVWYLSDRTWPPPNFNHLNLALAQTRWQGPAVTQENWKDIVADALGRVDWRRAVEDVAPFLERPREIDLINERTLHDLLGR
jgi:predicted nucleotidyltransferase component of viral defense system